jgi:phage/conjugal plasmid C-4 type zinc finger TraR family protein
MATGWAGDGAVQEQIDQSIADAIQKARSQLPKGESALHCVECGVEIPAGRREAIPGVQLCVACQEEADALQSTASTLYNRRGSKDSQLR